MAETAMKTQISLFCILLTALLAPGVTFAQSAAQPELPRTYLQTAYAAPSGQRHLVRAGDSLQAALTAAAPGDLITLEAGATFIGSFTLPTKTGTGWIYIQSASLGALPPEGTRVGPQHAALMPKILTHNSMPALRMAAGAHHYRLVGIELGITSSNTLNYSVLRRLCEGGTAGGCQAGRGAAQRQHGDPRQPPERVPRRGPGGAGHRRVVGARALQDRQ